MIEMDFKVKLPAVVEAATAKYREENDWLNHFLTECCEIDTTYTTRSGEVYQAYRTYCNETGEFFRSTAEFYAALEVSGFSRKRTSSANLITGLRLKSREFSADSGFDDFLK